MEERAKRFLNAYNTIDHLLRVLYGQKRSLTFSDVVRRTVNFNGIVRKYEEKLVDYGRLRNAIVHSNNPGIVIAEPHEDVVQEIEKIAELISIPPQALTLARKEVAGVESKAMLADVISSAIDKGFSNMAVFENEAIVGVINLTVLMKVIGKIIHDGKSVDDFVHKTKAKDVLEKMKDMHYYSIEPQDLSVEKALSLFYENRKLTAIVITKNGNFLEKPLGILTTADIMDLDHILEDY